jgi:hypothetical protein
MYIVKNGVLEIYVSVDHVTMCVERLYRGSIMNHRAFLVGDRSDIKAKCAQTQTLFFLTFDQMKKLCMKNSKLDQEILKIKNSCQGKENPYFIDYIMSRSLID